MIDRSRKRGPPDAGNGESPPLENGGGPAKFATDLSGDLQDPGATGRRVVLVVEDGEDLRQFLKRTLERYDFAVLEAGSAEEALVLANAVPHAIDVLLMDIMLPDSWGTRLAEDIRTLHPGIGVVLTSGHTVEDPVLGAGISQREPFLKKPFEIRELMDAITTVMAAAALEGPPHSGEASP